MEPRYKSFLVIHKIQFIGSIPDSHRKNNQFQTNQCSAKLHMKIIKSHEIPVIVGALQWIVASKTHQIDVIVYHHDIANFVERIQTSSCIRSYQVGHAYELHHPHRHRALDTKLLFCYQSSSYHNGSLCMERRRSIVPKHVRSLIRDEHFNNKFIR